MKALTKRFYKCALTEAKACIIIHPTQQSWWHVSNLQNGYGKWFFRYEFCRMYPPAIKTFLGQMRPRTTKRSKLTVDESKADLSKKPVASVDWEQTTWGTRWTGWVAVDQHAQPHCQTILLIAAQVAQKWHDKCRPQTVCAFHCQLPSHSLSTRNSAYTNTSYISHVLYDKYNVQTTLSPINDCPYDLRQRRTYLTGHKSSTPFVLKLITSLSLAKLVTWMNVTLLSGLCIKIVIDNCHLSAVHIFTYVCMYTCM